jgi:polysaccharide biosynthesis protein PslJ
VSLSAYNWRARFVARVGQSTVLRHVLVALFAILIGLVGGAAVAFGPFWAAFVALAALACAYAMLVNTSIGLAVVLFLITVLPFGTLPFKAVVTPSFLELALIALLAVWLLRLLSRPEEPLLLTPLGLPIVGFLGLTLFSFLLGSGGSPDSLTLHNYFKFLLGVLFFFSVVNCVRTREQAAWTLRLLLIGGALSALIGLILYAMRDSTALQILTALGRIGYPTTGRVLRYVEDDPGGIERAIGLSVDPNSYGGMLALVGALAITQAVAERPVLPRRLLVPLAGVLALTALLTASRAAAGGLLAGTIYAALLRYRRLWWAVLAAALLAVLLYVGFGVGGRFVERFVQGAQFSDQANLMRLGEYRNAIEIISRYPIFGIGFAQAPDIDLGAGVSSIYLALAERIGLVGLFGFLGIVAAFFLRGWRALRAALRPPADLELGGWLVGLQAGVAAALAVGLLDHYFFNIEFSHMVALFWGVIGLALALETTNDQRPTTNDQRPTTNDQRLLTTAGEQDKGTRGHADKEIVL